MSHIAREKKILKELVRARKAVKRKFNLIKSQKDNTERILNETFKPITYPLQQFIKKKTDESFNDQIKKDESLKHENDDDDDDEYESLKHENDDDDDNDDENDNSNVHSFKYKNEDASYNDLDDKIVENIVNLQVSDADCDKI